MFERYESKAISVVLIVVILLGLTLVSGASAMEGWPKSGVQSPLLAGTPKTITINLGPADPMIDPVNYWFGAGLMVQNQLFIGLTKFDDQNITIEPHLASSWVQNGPATEFTFTLRSDAEWTDGSPVTANDVRYGILRSLDPVAPSDFAYMLDVIHNAQEYREGTITDPTLVGVTVLDPTHIRFDLRESASHFPAIVANAPARPMPEWTITTHGSSWTEPANIVTNGAYELSEWIHSTSMTLDKNPDYFDASEVQIETIEFSIVDEATAWTMFQSGLLDSVHVPEGEWTVAMANPALQNLLHRAFRQCTYYYGFNTSKAPFDDPLVRKAFTAAINRQGLIDTVMHGIPSSALTYASPTMVGYVDGVLLGRGIHYNPTQAQTWLSDAGYPGGAGFPAVTLMYNESAGHAAIADYARQNWIDNLGVTVTLEDLPWAEYLDLLNTDPPHIFRLGWCADPYDAVSFLDDGVNPTFFGGWSNVSLLLRLWHGYRFASDPQLQHERLWGLYRGLDSDGSGNFLAVDYALTRPHYSWKIRS
jgi:ABC-type oligopeptide transport system substrate-binding subunit